ncbi:metalloregulator ArsR/SmtB family transcription factor [Mangrovimonas sp. YM274]|uniref:helix-turn-helix transcriptional regulator n=1 Tax=Mangrovimonas sp. YM274 TaxID=3070660 RepID=UPI0027DD339D|nr:metalloregulator ArsR/SmtB family transcription factor [Mangrovimonas sp. YM274]WMI68134.1 transcriptional regulator [Mangrovimonas sp. YM274]
MKKAADKILMILKMQGEVSLHSLASELGITKEGARLHLLKLIEKKLVITTSKKEGVGRPVTYYSLSKQSASEFPDSHAQVTVELLQSVKNLLGANALDLLINDRESKIYQIYKDALANSTTIENRLEKLSAIRSKEGYLAEWKKEGGDYFLIENHCPICAAATECQGFCRSELNNFRQILGDEFIVERMEHIVSGGQRCTYRISSKNQ